MIDGSGAKALVAKKTDLIRVFAQEVGLVLPDEDFTRPEFLPIDYQNQWLENFDENTYHSDFSAVNRGDIVQAGISANHFKARRQRGELEESEPLRFGKLIHMLILEPQRFKKTFVLSPEFGDMRSSKNRGARDAWKDSLEAGSTIVTREDLVVMFCMAKAIMKNDFACDLLIGSQFEMTGYYRDPVTGLKCRFRSDAWNPEIGALVDLKSTKDASEKEFLWSSWNYGYHTQMGAYSSGIEVIHKVKPDIHAIIAVEKVPPFECMVHLANKDFMKRGYKEYRRGLDTIAKALETNEFPGYDKSACELALPRKAQYE